MRRVGQRLRPDDSGRRKSARDAVDTRREAANNVAVGRFDGPFRGDCAQGSCCCFGGGGGDNCQFRGRVDLGGSCWLVSLLASCAQSVNCVAVRVRQAAQIITSACKFAEQGTRKEERKRADNADKKRQITTLLFALSCLALLLLCAGCGGSAQAAAARQRGSARRRRRAKNLSGRCNLAGQSLAKKLSERRVCSPGGHLIYRRGAQAADSSPAGQWRAQSRKRRDSLHCKTSAHANKWSV